MTRRLIDGPRLALAAVAAVAACGSLTACGGDDGGHDGDHDPSAAQQTAPNGDVFSAADVDFATHMIPHHAQAVQMTVLAQDRPLDPEVQQLVAQIREAQVPEIETMTDWLTAWGEDVPETSLDHAHAGHDMDEMSVPEGADDMPGMMGQDQMDALAAAADSEFQTLWLEMMIEHHQGAMEMAQEQQSAGEFAAALKLAETIESGQAAEIEVMERLLG